MPDSLDDRAKRVFDEAIELGPPGRAALLERACGSDAALRTRVEKLLRGAEAADGFLSRPTAGMSGISLQPPRVEQPGGRIGPYRLLELIGEGGFGSVFMAEQTEPVRRRVALKIIKLGMDTRAVVGRFEQERQALALMDHPNIARVLDAGATESGRPYFVMELVRGEPITAFCDQANLNIPERLALFTQACRAVQHAHTKGIIHRDIKPNNVLASAPDDRPLCKIIDFGIAKATLQPLTDKTLFTEFRQLIGTPAYMSPEQAGGGLDIDTRTDVYSLGVLLYELLAGAPPFDPQRFSGASLVEVQRILREIDPPAPSTRISKSATLASIAAHRRTEPRRLGALVRGELDWIVMRALEKDRARRYESAGELASDVDRYLAGAAVLAAPQSVAYRVSKFIGRHRAGVVTACLVILALCGGLAAALWQAGIAARERDKQKELTTKAVAQEKIADQRRKDVEQVAAFEADQLSGIDLEKMGLRLRDDLLADARAALERSGTPPEEITARQAQLAGLLADVNSSDLARETLQKNVFDRALQTVKDKFANQPLIQARLLQTLADTLAALGMLDAADPPGIEALALRRRELGDDHPDTLESVHQRAQVLEAQGKLPESEAAFREALAGRTRALGADDPVTLDSMSNLAVVLQLENKLPESEELNLHALAGLERLVGPDDQKTIEAVNNLGFLYFAEGRLPDAERCFQRGLAAQRRIKGENDPLVLALMNNLASIIQREDKLSEAEALFRDAYQRGRATQGEDHFNTIQLENNLAFVLYLQDKLAEADPLTRDTLERRRRVLKDDHWDTLQSLNNMGLLLQAEGKLDDAEPYFREALERRTRILGETHQATLQSLCNLGTLLRDRKDFAGAEPLLRAALEKRAAGLGPDHPDTIESHERLGVLLAMAGRLPDAEPELRSAFAGYVTKSGPTHSNSARAEYELGRAISEQSRFAEAEPLLLAAATALEKQAGPSADVWRRCATALVHLYEGWDAAAPGNGYDQKASDWRAKCGI